MTACPVCGREFREDISLCPFDGQQLVAVITGNDSVEDAEPDTVVRPKRAQPLGTPRFTEVQIQTPAGSAPADVVMPTGTPDRVYPARPMWPFVTAIAVVSAVALSIIGYLALSRQSDMSTEVGAQISEARVAVADARARLESLPTDSVLRGRILQLQQWDRELQNFELEPDRDRAMASRAREIEGLARAIGDEARAAGAAVPSAPPQVTPAVPPPAVPDASTTTATDVDPMAAKPAETPAPATDPDGKPVTDPAKPAAAGGTEPAAVPTKPAEGEAAKPKPSEPAQPPADAKTEQKPASPPPAPTKPR